MISVYSRINPSVCMCLLKINIELSLKIQRVNNSKNIKYLCETYL